MATAQENKIRLDKHSEQIQVLEIEQTLHKVCYDSMPALRKVINKGVTQDATQEQTLRTMSRLLWAIFGMMLSVIGALIVAGFTGKI